MLEEPAKESSGPNGPLEPVAIRSQLNRVLAHPLFTHSKRYPVLLGYVVEQTLLGRGAHLKERTIGVEAFGREPDYNVSFDPVVRTSASEVRKRLIQYYYDPEHSGELVIELFAGSYIPAFREPEPRKIEAPEISPESVQPDAPPAVPPSSMLNVPEIIKPRHSRTRKQMLAAVWILLALAAGFAIGRIGLARRLRASTVSGSRSLQVNTRSRIAWASQAMRQNCRVPYSEAIRVYGTLCPGA